MKCSFLFLIINLIFFGAEAQSLLLGKVSDGSDPIDFA
jgi:hypothetical protein